MSKKAFQIWAGILAVVISTLIWANASMHRGPEPDAIYEMANRNIEWTGAGYDGIYGRK